MSKLPELDYEFDPQRFVKLLLEAKGRRTQAEYASQSGISTAHLNKIMNGSFVKPPTPATIKKLSLCADDRVSYEDLLRAAGYDPAKYITNGDNYYLLKKAAIGEITSCLAGLKLEDDDLEIKFIKNKLDFYDLGITISDEGGGSVLMDWLFDVCNEDSDMDVTEYIHRRIYTYLQSNINEITKVSIVTFNRDMLDSAMKYPRFHLSFCISVILIDKNTMKIEEETYLRTDSDYRGFFEIKLV
ncbi:MAG: helix-turn-helix domain-containing protein [Lachnospiraceae bacterium]|nr:helix-turn-helix domain-containing protein [Lachnospiraceae bacterium]